MPLEKEDMDEMSNCVEKLYGMSCWADELARSLKRVGLPISKELHEMSIQQHDLSDILRRIIGNTVQSDLRLSREMTVTVVESALAGIKLAGADKDEKGEIDEGE